MTEVEKMLACTPSEIRVHLAESGAASALKASYCDTFPPVMGFFPRAVTDEQLVVWWGLYIKANTSREHWMRDGWRSGVDYGDM